MLSVMKKLTVALAAGLCLTVAGAFSHGDHGAKVASGCCKSKPAAECAGSSSSKACPSQTAAALPECCAKTAAGNKQDCCAKHAAGQPQPCCEKHQVSAAPAGCCKAKADAAAATNPNLSSNMQSLMQKVDELRRKRQ